MGNDVSSLEANHLVVAHQRGVTIVALAGLQDALKLGVVIRVPPPCGPMLLMEIIKGLYLRQQTTALLQPSTNVSNVCELLGQLESSKQHEPYRLAVPCHPTMST